MSDSELVDGLFLSLSAFLSTEWKGQRQPYRFLENVRTASSAPSHDTSRIFLDSGFKAWVAYFVGKPTTANADGQALRRRQFAALDRLSVSERKGFAVKVNEVLPHPTVATLILSMERDARMPNSAVASLVPSKRPRAEHDDFGLSSSSAYPSPGYSQSLGDNLQATADSAPLADAAVNNLMSAWTPRHYDFAPTFSSTDHCPRSLQLSTDTSRGTIDASTSPEAETLTGADIPELDLFPEYLAGAIRRYDTTPKTAAVSIQFPANSIGDVNCIMIIEVLPNKVERLASLLFNAHLETDGNERELILPGGLCVVPTRLQGSPLESVTHVFGSTTAAALESAPYRKIEVAESGSRVATRCITMTECSDAKKGALIKVTLGRREASKIYEKLFKSKSRSRFP
ncbi:hypothetical protein INS49_014048 [Diaporthe citri]|uniref:uncharacterized protein n=1 Tax=Diaporthe citri TaxID=83186 RepID=UPI001C804D33|nr:uncharacterized protein INS49_014048 [Diaporthe citri]KAG6358164.1 hypothetical protein INS49_014048 [Diaporthe citri]